MILLINIQWKYSLQVHITITQNGMLVNLCANNPYLPRLSKQNRKYSLIVEFLVTILYKTALDIWGVYKTLQISNGNKMIYQSGVKTWCLPIVEFVDTHIWKRQ